MAEFERGKVLRGCGIARVWFTIEPYKVTEQWHKEV